MTDNTLTAAERNEMERLRARAPRTGRETAEGPSARDLLCCATTMTDGRRGIRERVTLIAKKPKTLAAAAAAMLLVCALAVGCTFTGAKEKTDLSAGGVWITLEGTGVSGIEYQTAAQAGGVINADNTTFSAGECLLLECGAIEEAERMGAAGFTVQVKGESAAGGETVLASETFSCAPGTERIDLLYGENGRLVRLEEGAKQLYALRFSSVSDKKAVEALLSALEIEALYGPYTVESGQDNSLLLQFTDRTMIQLEAQSCDPLMKLKAALFIALSGDCTALRWSVPLLDEAVGAGEVFEGYADNADVQVLGGIADSLFAFNRYVAMLGDGGAQQPTFDFAASLRSGAAFLVGDYIFRVSLPASWEGKYSFVSDPHGVQYSSTANAETGGKLFGIYYLTDAEAADPWENGLALDGCELLKRLPDGGGIYAVIPYTDVQWVESDQAAAEEYQSMLAEQAVICASLQVFWDNLAPLEADGTLTDMDISGGQSLMLVETSAGESYTFDYAPLMQRGDDYTIGERVTLTLDRTGAVKGIRKWGGSLLPSTLRDGDLPLSSAEVMLDYADERTLIFHIPYGLFVYDLASRSILHSADLAATVGTRNLDWSNAPFAEVAVSADGKRIQLNAVVNNTFQRASSAFYINTRSFLYEVKPYAAMEDRFQSSDGLLLFDGDTVGSLRYQFGDETYRLFDTYLAAQKLQVMTTGGAPIGCQVGFAAADMDDGAQMAAADALDGFSFTQADTAWQRLELVYPAEKAVRADVRCRAAEQSGFTTCAADRDGTFALPAEVGRYYYRVELAWPDGGRDTAYFTVTVVR